MLFGADHVSETGQSISHILSCLHPRSNPRGGCHHISHTTQLKYEVSFRGHAASHCCKWDFRALGCAIHGPHCVASRDACPKTIYQGPSLILIVPPYRRERVGGKGHQATSARSKAIICGFHC